MHLCTEGAMTSAEQYIACSALRYKVYYKVYYSALLGWGGTVHGVLWPVYCSNMQWNILQCSTVIYNAVEYVEVHCAQCRAGVLWPVLSQDGKITCSPSQQHPPTKARKKEDLHFFDIFDSHYMRIFSNKIFVIVSRWQIIWEYVLNDCVSCFSNTKVKNTC